jgi:hypothetical protein
MEEKEYAVHPMLAKEMYPETPLVVETAAPDHTDQGFMQDAPIQPVVENQTTNDTVMAENQIAQAAPQENSIGKNLRLLREKAERAERERDEMMRMLQLEREIRGPARDNTPQPQDDMFSDIDIAEDDYVDGKKFKAMQKQMKNLLMQNMQQQQTQQLANQQLAIEAKIKSQYPDFDRIVTRDNIEMLNAMDPILANALNKSPDLYEKAVSTYNVIKKFNINNYSQEEQNGRKIKENQSKPRSLASISPQTADSPLSRVNIFAQGLTKDVKEMLNKEMNEAIANRQR